MDKKQAQELIDKKDFSKYGFEYLDGFVDGAESEELKECENCKHNQNCEILTLNDIPFNEKFSCSRWGNNG